MTATLDSEWATYCENGRLRALGLGNRGPMRFDAKGRLAQDILDAYWRTGFYVFEDVLEQGEIDDLTREFDEVLANAPTHKGGWTDGQGRPSKHPGYYTLSDRGDFEKIGVEWQSDDEAVVGLISHPLMMMDSALCVYGHPDILRMVASVHGDDFIPFHESIFHKGVGEGPPTSWHQDGRTHWDAEGRALETEDGQGKRHGFNLSVSWSTCTPENCLWVVPGSHRSWRLHNDGSFPPITERIADAVPMMLNPGDCGMVNRSSLHGSYSNRSDERRVTMVLGFHHRESAIGTSTTNVHAFPRPGKSKRITYSREYVEKRSRMIPLAIDARRRKYPDETPFEYRGAYLGSGEWNEQTRLEIAEPGDEYWQRDITL